MNEIDWHPKREANDDSIGVLKEIMRSSIYNFVNI